VATGSIVDVLRRFPIIAPSIETEKPSIGARRAGPDRPSAAASANQAAHSRRVSPMRPLRATSTGHQPPARSGSSVISARTATAALIAWIATTST
jgi:hypothetical protein